MKYVAMIALTVVALGFGACAHKKESTMSTTSTASTGYSK